MATSEPRIIGDFPWALSVGNGPTRTDRQRRAGRRSLEVIPVVVLALLFQHRIVSDPNVWRGKELGAYRFTSRRSWACTYWKVTKVLNLTYSPGVGLFSLGTAPFDPSVKRSWRFIQMNGHSHCSNCERIERCTRIQSFRMGS